MHMRVISILLYIYHNRFHQLHQCTIRDRQRSRHLQHRDRVYRPWLMSLWKACILFLVQLVSKQSCDDSSCKMRDLAFKIFKNFLRLILTKSNCNRGTRDLSRMHLQHGTGLASSFSKFNSVDSLNLYSAAWHDLLKL